MSDDVYVLRSLEILLRAGDGHRLAEVLKVCAAEMVTRGLAGYQLVYDVAFGIHSATSHATIEAHVRKALDLPPSS